MKREEEEEIHSASPERPLHPSQYRDERRVYVWVEVCGGRQMFAPQFKLHFCCVGGGHRGHVARRLLPAELISTASLLMLPSPASSLLFYFQKHETSVNAFICSLPGSLFICIVTSVRQPTKALEAY